MINKLEYIQCGDNTYPMAFTLNVMENIENEYGGLNSWIKQIDKEEPSYKAIKFMLFEVINEGIEIENEQKTRNKDREMISTKQVGRLITNIGFENLGLKLFKLIQDALPSGNVSKNQHPMQSAKKQTLHGYYS